jgi:hypothetical protein
MKHLKYLAFAAVAVVLATSVATANAATGKPPAQGTPPAGQQEGQQGQPPDGQGGPGRGGPGGGGPGGLEGIVTAISGSSYTIQDTRTQTTTETTVTMTDTVKVRYLVTDTAASLSDITVGTRVQVRGRPGDDKTMTVEEVVIEPAGDKLSGMVSDVSDATITLKTRDETYSIVTSSSTQFLKGTESASLSDVVSDTLVTAYGSLSDNTLTATVVIVGGGRGGGQGGPGDQQGNPPPQDGSNQPGPQGTPPAQ